MNLKKGQCSDSGSLWINRHKDDHAQKNRRGHQLMLCQVFGLDSCEPIDRMLAATETVISTLYQVGHMEGGS